MQHESKSAMRFTEYMLAGVKSGLSLYSVVNLMGSKKSVPGLIKKAAEEMKNMLEGGHSLSFCFKECTSIRFSEVYVAFVKTAEESGKITECFEYLIEENKRMERQTCKLLMNGIYPSIVIMFSIIGCFLILKFSDRLIVDFSGSFDEAAYKKNALNGCIQANLFLFVSLIVFALWIYKKVFENYKYNFFKILLFLVEGNVPLYDALKISLLISGSDKRIKKGIVEALSMLEQGNNVDDSFQCITREMKLDVDFDGSTGNIKNCLKNITETLSYNQSKNEKMTDALLEPGIIMVVTVYLLILLVKIVFPVMYSYRI